MPKVSVIIPTYNRAGLLPRAVQSAKDAGKDVEIIVVDDASTDDTESICCEMSGIVYVRLNWNVGLASARNVGIKKSNGEFLIFLDDDDLRLPNSINKQSELLDHDKTLGFVYGQVWMAEPETLLLTGEVRPTYCPTGDIFWNLIYGNFISVNSVLARRRYVETVGLFKQGLRRFEDWDLWLKLAAISKIDAVHEPVGVVREPSRRSDQLSSNRPSMCKWGARIQANALRLPPALTVDRRIRREVRSEYIIGLWDQLIKEGHHSLSERQIAYAMSNYITALQLCPKRAFRFGAIASFARSIVSMIR